MIRFVSSSCKIVSMSSFDGVLEAWKFSRPNDTDPNLEDILKLDVPVNEFGQVILQFHCPILIREYLCSLRDHVVWARTSRVDDLSDWEVTDAAIGMKAKFHALKIKMEKLQEAGNNQDSFRQLLPLGYMTRFSFATSFRGLIRILGLFKKEFMKTDDKAIGEIFFQLIHTLRNELLSTEPGQFLLTHSVDNFKAVSPLSKESFEIEREGAFRIGGFINLEAEISLALRAQLVRHRQILFEDNLIDFFNLNGLTKPLTSKLNFSCVMTDQMAQDLTRSRNCWIAQTDLWAPVVSLLRGLQGADGAPPLPCDGGSCPFKKDNALRIEGKDPNPPCPRAAVLANEKLSEGQLNFATVYASERNDFEFWKKELVNAERI